MKSKLTFLAMIMAAMVVFGAVNEAQASGTRCNSLTIYDAPQYVFAESLMWSQNPGSIAYFPSLVSVLWGTSSNINGLGVILLQPTMKDSILVSAATTGNIGAMAGAIGTDAGYFGSWSAAAAGDVNGVRTGNGAIGSINVSLTYARKIGMYSIAAEVGLGYTDNNVSDGDVSYKFYEPIIKIGSTMPISSALWIEAAIWLKFPMISAESKDTFVYASDGVAYDLTYGHVLTTGLTSSTICIPGLLIQPAVTTQRMRTSEAVLT